ncbi:MAG: transposase [Nocardioidaceae bacterium]
MAALADVGDVTRFADRTRFASGAGTASLDASSGEQSRHRLLRAGHRRMNRMIHIAPISQIRLDTDGRDHYRRKRAQGKKPLEAIRCLKRRISDAIYRQLLEDAERATTKKTARVREDTAGLLKDPARSTFPAHRNFGSATSRTRGSDATPDRLTTEGSR